MKSRVWVHEYEPRRDDLDDTDYLIYPVIVTLGLRSKISRNPPIQETIDYFTPWALDELFWTCAEVAWRCGVTSIKRRFGWTSEKLGCAATGET